TVRSHLDSDYFAGAGPCAGERESALTGETVQNPPSLGVLGDQLIVRQLIEIEAGLLGMEQVDLQFQTRDLDFDFVRRVAAQDTAAQFHPLRAPNDCIVALDDL